MTGDRQLAMADGTNVFVTLVDGPADRVPLLCLPGLTRNSRDFEPVISAYSGTRAILAMDFRGRGRSGHAADPASYTPAVELADTIAVLDSYSLDRVALLGTSRGGIVGMLMAGMHQERLSGLFLNDVGPRIEPDGMLRLMGHVGVAAEFPDWAAAADALARARPEFRNVSPAAWRQVASRVFTERGNRIVPDYDLRLATTLPDRELVKTGQLSELWDLLPALQDKPVTILRGENSDLLSPATVARFKTALPHAACANVPGRGHVPFLDEPESLAAVASWLALVDQKEMATPVGFEPTT